MSRLHHSMIFCVLLLSLLIQPSPAQEPERQSPPTINIVKSLRTAAVTVKGRGPLPDKDEPPPAGKSWLVVIATLTTSRAETWVSLDSIRVLDESGKAETPIGLMKGTTASLLFYDVEMAYGAKLLALRFEDKPVYSEFEEGAVRIQLFRKGEKYLFFVPAARTLPIELLFAVPSGAKRLQLQFGEATMIPLTTSKSSPPGTEVLDRSKPQPQTAGKAALADVVKRIDSVVRSIGGPILEFKNTAMDTTYNFAEEKIQVKKGVPRSDLIGIALFFGDEWGAAGDIEFKGGMIGRCAHFPSYVREGTRARVEGQVYVYRKGEWCSAP